MNFKSQHMELSSRLLDGFETKWHLHVSHASTNYEFCEHGLWSDPCLWKAQDKVNVFAMNDKNY